MSRLFRVSVPLRGAGRVGAVVLSLALVVAVLAPVVGGPAAGAVGGASGGPFALDAANGTPRAVWSDGVTLWVSDRSGRLFAYDLATMERDLGKDVSALADAGNRNGQGLWSDGVTVWVSDWADDKVYAYDLATGARRAGSDIDTLGAAGNNHPKGLWSDGTTLWVVDGLDDKIYAYDLATGARRPGSDIDTLFVAGNRRAAGLWSDGTTLWVVDDRDDKLYAYELATGVRQPGRDLDGLGAAGNHVPKGIWSDGSTVWVSDLQDDMVYAYDLPTAPDPLVWSAVLTVGGSAGVSPPPLGYTGWSPTSSMGGLSDDEFFVGSLSFRVKALLDHAGGLTLGLDRELGSDFVLEVDGERFAASESLVPTLGARGRYWWPAPSRGWSVGDLVEVSVTVEGSGEVAGRAAAPPSAYFSGVPESHDGIGEFGVRLYFDEADLAIDAALLRDLALEVDGATVATVESRGSRQTWDIALRPLGDADVTVALPAATDCALAGAICSSDGRGLRSRVEMTVAGPATTAADASLGVLELNGAVLSPAFDPDVVLYTAIADTAVSVIDVDATAARAGAVVEISPTDADPAAGHQVALTAGGQTPLTVTVTAADGKTVRRYWVVIDRPADAQSTPVEVDDSVPQLSGLGLDGLEPIPFDPDRVRYETRAAPGAGTATVIPSRQHSDAVVEVFTVRSDDPSLTPHSSDDGSEEGHQATLSETGDTLLVVRVTSPDGQRQQIYVILVDSTFEHIPAPPLSRGVHGFPRSGVRSDPPALSSLSIENVDLSPVFAADVYVYAASVEADVSTITVTAETTDSGATVSFVPIDASTATGHQVTLLEGEPGGEPTVTSFAVVVRAADNSLSTYVVDVTRAAPPSDDATLAALTLASTDLTPGFAADTYVYAASVPADVSKVTVDAQSTHSAADVTISPTDADADSANGHQVALSEGEPGETATTTITVVVRSEDGNNLNTYMIDVTRAATPMPVEDLAPQNLTAEAVTSPAFGVLLRWDAPQVLAGSITGYQILRKNLSAGETAFSAVAADTGSISTVYLDTTVGFEANTYAYQVKGLRDTEVSEAANEATIAYGPYAASWLDIEAPGHTFVPRFHESTHSYVLRAPHWAETIQLYVSVESSGDTYAISSNNDSSVVDDVVDLSGDDVITVVVSKNDGTTATYTLEVVVADDVSVSESYSVDFPNSYATTGRVVVGGSAEGGYHGRLDEDFFRVDLQAGRAYLIKLKGRSNSVFGTAVWKPRLGGIADSSGTDIPDVEVVTATGRVSEIYFEPILSGLHYLSVKAVYWESHDEHGYELKVEEVPLRRDQPNDTSTGATVEVGGGTVVAEIESLWDRDWFRVHLDEGTLYHFEIMGAATGHGTLKDPALWGLRDAHGVLIPNTKSRTGGAGDCDWTVLCPSSNVRMSYTATTTGDHFMSVGNYDDTAALDYPDLGTYAVKVTVAVDDIPADISTTETVEVGGVQARGAIQFDDDVDWFAVELQQGVEYRILMESGPMRTSRMPYPQLRDLRDSNGAIIPNSSAYSSYDDYSQTYFVPTYTGIHYITASHGHEYRFDPRPNWIVTELGGYRLHLDEFTEDFSADTSTVGEVEVDGAAIIGEIEKEFDVDWFAVDFESGMEYWVEVIGTPRTGTQNGLSLWNPQLKKIFDSSGTAISGTFIDNGGEHYDARLKFSATDTGTHYIAAGGKSDILGSYAVRVSTATDDFADDSSTTGVVEVGGSTTGNIEGTRDEDWFAVTLQAGNLYRIDLEGSDTGAGTLADPQLLMARDPLGNQIFRACAESWGAGWLRVPE